MNNSIHSGIKVLLTGALALVLSFFQSYSVTNGNLPSKPEIKSLESSNGTYRLSGRIISYVRFSPSGIPLTTNVIRVKGVIIGEQFGASLFPEQTAETEEHIGWNGDCVYILKRFPEWLGKNLPREHSLAYLEPTVYARYATGEGKSLAMALADHAAAQALTNKESPPMILTHLRMYPEESSQYSMDYVRRFEWAAKCICPGIEIDQQGRSNALAEVYANGFLRWEFACRLEETNEASMKVSFEMRVYHPKPKLHKPRHAGDLQLSGVITGRLTIVADATVSQADILPVIQEDSLPVWDFRQRKAFAAAHGSYDRDYLVKTFITNRQWLQADMTAIKDAAITELGIQILKERGSKPDYKKFIFSAVFVLILFAPAVYAVLRRMAKVQPDCENER